MTRRKVFGSHLYNQIVATLLVASVVIGFIAAMVAGTSVRSVTDRWVTQVADAVTASVADCYDYHGEQVQRAARSVARDHDLQAAAQAGDADSLSRAVSAVSATLGYDGVLVLDESGSVLAAAGAAKFGAESRPLGAIGAATSGTSRSSRTIMMRLGDDGALIAIEPLVGPQGHHYSVAVIRTMTDEFLTSLGGTTDGIFGLYGPDKQVVAYSKAASLTDRESETLRAALMADNQMVARVLDRAESGASGVAHVRVGGVSYEVFARRIPPQPCAGGGDGDVGFVLGVISEAVSEEASRTTTNLIMVWGIVAVVVLIALGSWVARVVSEPLAVLSEGARRIADGDFSTEVEIRGHSEVARLAVAFNDMTESLRTRSESLTKKVLELATLYEMSRALGSTLDMDELLSSVLDSALRIFDLDLGYVALRDKETDALAVRVVRGGGPATDAVRLSMSEWVVREGRPLIFNPDSNADEGQTDNVTGARAALCVPLVSSEGTIGSITVGSADLDYRFHSDDVRLLSTIANHVAIAIGNIELFTSLQEAYLATVRSLAAAVDAKDSYTRGHSDRVAGYAILIAERLGISHEQRVALEMAAYLHDIGKIGVSGEILLKPGRLTENETEQMRHHPLIGANILKPVAFPWAIMPIVRHHHEHFDGSGYPAGLKGEEIPLLARVLTAADSYEAMTADRPYRRGLSPEAATEELRSCAGTQFDPRVVDILVQIVQESEPVIEGTSQEEADEVEHEEVRAIFAALIDGVFSSFRRLGGPRLASNVEKDVDWQFKKRHWPFGITRGRVGFAESIAQDSEAELAQMREAMRIIDSTLARVSGATLVEHFYSDAYDGFPARLRSLADELGFRAR